MFIFCFACTKQEIKTGYEMVVDQHSLDTTILYNRYIQNLGYPIPSEAIKLDTAKDMWYIDCSIPDRLQHLYYTKDGIKIQKQ